MAVNESHDHHNATPATGKADSGTGEASGNAEGDLPLPENPTHADHAPAATPEDWADKSTGADINADPEADDDGNAKP